MASFIVSYDLNGPHPSHKEMDQHLAKLGAARARILETIWYVGANSTAPQLRDYIRSILDQEDLLLVADATDAAWTKLLVNGQSLIDAWKENQRR